MITTGVTGGRWRASVTPYGAIVPDELDQRLDWHVAADDRWHSPEHEASVRQRRVDGTAVVETRVRVPDGDAVQRVYSVPDHGGLTVIEIENESPLPIAVAFSNGNLLSRRPPAAPIEGISLPPASVAFPIGHHATLTVAIPHAASTAGGALPTALPSAAAVARGWLSTTERAGRLLLPTAELNERIIATRCELVLRGASSVDDDAAAFLVAIDQMTRMGDAADPFLPAVSHAVEIAAKEAFEMSSADWFTVAALGAADRVLATAGDDRARRDLAAVSQRLTLLEELPVDEPSDPFRALTWIEQCLVAPRLGRAELLSPGLPDSWLGIDFELFGLPASGTGTVSFALRWHGDRPAILWEQSVGSDGPVTLTSPTLAPRWESAEVSGEALWDKHNR